jgi:hypothetical protein
MRKLKMGMVAVENAFIGAIHRIAKIDGLLNCIVVLLVKFRNIKRIRKSFVSS